MDRLIGDPLSTVLLSLEKKEFCLLWLSGDKILQSRMKTLSLECEEFPYTVDCNIVLLKRASIAAVLRNSEVIFERRSNSGRLLTQIQYKLPSSLVELSLKCGGHTWIKLSFVLKGLPHLVKLTLDVDDRDVDRGKLYIGFPETLTSLNLQTFGTKSLESALTLPNLEELELGRSFSCGKQKDDYYALRGDHYSKQHCHKYDLSSTNLKSISLRCPQCRVIFPPTMTKLGDYYELDGTYENLIEAYVHKLKGSYPSIQALHVMESGDLSGCNKNACISIGCPPSVYENGHLKLDHLEEAEMFSVFPVTTVDYDTYWGYRSADEIDAIIEMFPSITSISIGYCGDGPRIRVTNEKIPITYYKSTVPR